MKVPSMIKKFTFLLTTVILLTSCKQTPEKNISSPKHDEITNGKKEVLASNPEKKTNSNNKKSENLNNEKNNLPAKSVSIKGSDKWEANPSASKIGFSVKGPFGTVNGTLGGLQATIEFDKNNLAASSIIASTQTRTISTGIKLRNKDLQKEKYLAAGKYPEITFRSDKIEKSGNGYKAIGTLKIKGVSKKEEIPFSFSENGNSGIFKGNFIIQRQEFGVGEPGGTIGNNVTVNFAIATTKPGK